MIHKGLHFALVNQRVGKLIDDNIEVVYHPPRPDQNVLNVSLARLCDIAGHDAVAANYDIGEADVDPTHRP